MGWTTKVLRVNLTTGTCVGLRGVAPHLLWSARNMGASDRELLWQISVPAALPQIMTGLQVALPILFERLPNLRLAGAPHYANLYHFHGLERLMLSF